MRRASVVGPLILILIGVAFLLHNVWPEVPLVETLAQYWPFLLIGWGALRLVEVLFWAMQAKPLPRSGISGGEWVFVIFLCLIGSSLYTAHHYRGWLPTGRGLRGMVVSMGETYDYTINPLSKTTEKPPRIVIENFRGNARISGVDGDQVKLSGRKTIRAFQQPDADKANTETGVELITQGNDIIVRSNQDRVNERLQVSNDFEITVPKGSSVEAHGRNGDFDIRDITGPVEVNSDNAGIRMDNLGGSARIEVRKSDLVRLTGVKGSVELKGRGQDLDLQNITGQVTVNGDFLGQIQMRNLAQPVRFEGGHVSLQFEKLPGQVHMGAGEFTANNIVGPIHLNSRASDVTMSDFSQSLDVNIERGDIELKPGPKTPMPKMDVRTHSGDVDLALPAGARFELRMVTERGEAHNEYGSPLTIDERDHGATIAGAVEAGPQLHLQSDRGNVTARKAGDPDENVDLKVEKQ